MYKRVDKKVRPIDDIPSNGSTPEGSIHWKLNRMGEAQVRVEEQRRINPSEWDEDFFPKFSTIKKGSRLTPERLEGILEKVKEVLQPREVTLFTHILYNREAALAWNFTECGRIHNDVFPPQRIRTIPHKAWQSKSIPIPRALTDKVIELLRDRVNRGILEESHAAYRNNWFLVKKKDGGLRLINDAQRINGVTLRDAFAPPGCEEFSEDFSGCKILSLLDLFSGYDQIGLDEKSRDLTTFSTPIGLFRMCTLPQGGTNSVAQFMRAMTRILYDLIPDVCRPYLNDICIKGPRLDYGGSMVREGIRRYVYEHL
mgnify:CR=1 FL=1